MSSSLLTAVDRVDRAVVLRHRLCDEPDLVGVHLPAPGEEAP
jgi:hypothetical protein